MYNNIFNTDTINIFTDASVKQFPLGGNTYYVSCPGFVTVKMFNGLPFICDQGCSLLYDSSNIEGEITAIANAIYNSAFYSSFVPKINIFSDSKISIQGITEWIYDWIRNMEGDTFKTNSNKIVSHQNVYKSIIYMISNMNYSLNFYHIKGHVNVNDRKSFDNARRVFRDSNNMDIDNYLLSQLCYYNNYIDNLSRDYLNNINKEMIGRQRLNLYSRIYDTEQGLSNYTNKINNDKKGYEENEIEKGNSQTNISKRNRQYHKNK